MSKKVFFLAGLPRSGSTLLANVLNQNPKFSVTSTSPLIELVLGMKARFTASPQRMAFGNHQDLRKMFQNAVKGMIHGFFEGHEIGIDKSREWMQERRLLKEIYGDDLKVIVPIRDLRGCLSSQEKLYRKAPESFWENDSMETGVRARVTQWMNTNPLGKSGSHIKAALEEEYANNGFLFIRMEDFTTHPEKVMPDIYEALGEDMFEHNFENVEQTIFENDSVHWPLGSHDLKGTKISPIPKDWDDILGDELSKEVIQNNLWFYRVFYPEILK